MTVWMIESALTVSIVVLAGVVASVVLRRQSAALRHWVLAVAVTCAWVTPPAHMVLPSWLDVPLWHTVDNMGPRQSSARQHGTPTVAVTTEASEVPVSFAGPNRRVSVVNVSAADVLWAVWIVGTLISAFMLAAGLTRLQWLASGADIIISGPWYDVAEDVRTAYQISTPIRLLQSDHASLLSSAAHWAAWVRSTASNCMTPSASSTPNDHQYQLKAASPPTRTRPWWTRMASTCVVSASTSSTAMETGKIKVAR